MASDPSHIESLIQHHVDPPKLYHLEWRFTWVIGHFVYWGYPVLYISNVVNFWEWTNCQACPDTICLELAEVKIVLMDSYY